MTTRFNDGWERLWPHADTEQNRAWMKHFGFGSLKEKSHYDY